MTHPRSPQAARDELREALEPFADFADPNNVFPASFVITSGSSLARRQLTMGDCYAARAALAAATPEPPEEFAWLIERGQSEGQVPTVWWTHNDEWTTDANEAQRFFSRDAAQTAIESRSGVLPRQRFIGRAVQHGFLRATPEPPDPYQDRSEHERQSLAGTHHLDPHCPFCFFDHFDAETRAAFVLNEQPEPPDLSALRRLAEASRNHTIATWRYVNGTGGGLTDEQMDERTKELLDATEAAFLVLAQQPETGG